MFAFTDWSWRHVTPYEGTLERDSRLTGVCVLPRDATVPEPCREERKSTGCREVNQKWRRQHEPSRHRSSGRQSAGQITVKRTGLGALRALVEQQLKRFRVGGQFGSADGRASDAARCWRRNAIPAKRPTAVRADHDRITCAMVEAFHFIRRYVAGLARKINSSPWHSTSPVISTGSATRSRTCLLTGLPSAETSSR